MTGPARIDALDGLRTLAVVAVIGFHVSLPFGHGGFAGVDLFFVLSGFLITGLLLDDLDRFDRVRLGEFWSRRFRRLMPALLVLIVVVGVWAALIALPVSRPGLRADLVWSTLYLANWHFISSSGYFADTGAASPLEHVWSLAVEEQFYLAWPLLVAGIGWLLLRPRKRSQQAPRPVPARLIGLTAAVLAVVSAALLAALFDPGAPDRAYLGTDTRAFEPLIGAALAAVLRSPKARAVVGRFAWALGAVAAAAVLLGLGLLGTADGPLPAYFHGGALAYAVACAGLIAALAVAPDRGLALVFRLAPLAWLGRISYGIYLWHWPLRVWIIEDDQWRPLHAAAVLIGSVALAAVSYHLIEQPIRTGALARRTRPRWTLITAVLIVGVTTAGASLVRVPAEAAGVRLVLVGDSVPKRLAPMLAEYARGDPAYASWLIGSGAVGSCPAMPVQPIQVGGRPHEVDCPDLVRTAQRSALRDVRPQAIVWWSRAEEYDRVGPDKTILRVGSDVFWNAQHADLLAAIDDLQRRAPGSVIVLVETDRPGTGIGSRCTPADCHWFLRRLLDQDDLRVRWNALLRRAATERAKVVVTPIDDVYCRDASVPCNDELSNGEPARPDGSHFSAAGGRLVSKALLDRVAAALG